MAFNSCFLPVQFQKPEDKKTTSVQNEVKQEAAEVAAEVLTKPEKKTHGKKSKKTSFICKPPVIHFKVQFTMLCQWPATNS